MAFRTRRKSIQRKILAPMKNIVPRIRDFDASDFDAVDQLWSLTHMGGSIRNDTPETIQRTLDAGGRLFILEDEISHQVIGTSW